MAACSDIRTDTTPTEKLTIDNALNTVHSPVALCHIQRTFKNTLEASTTNAKTSIFCAVITLGFAGLQFLALKAGGSTDAACLCFFIALTGLIGMVCNLVALLQRDWEGFGPKTPLIRAMLAHERRREAFNLRAQKITELGVAVDDGVKQFYLQERIALFAEQDRLAELLTLHRRAKTLQELSKLPDFGKKNTAFGETIDVSEAAFLARTQAEVASDAVRKVRQLPK